MTNPESPSSTSLDPDLLASCVHCGFCLEVCPTYKLTGDENNSPRGRLRLWREEADGRLPADPWTAHYTEECVGCLACESACPANVPYGRIFEEVRRDHVAHQRTQPGALIRWAAGLVTRPRLLNTLMTPVRWLRRTGLIRHRFLFRGHPAIFESTTDYARRMMAEHRPSGPRVALLTGCLMEAVFREINFATVRVLIANNVQVVVPPQNCCGAFQEHAGLPEADTLHERSRADFGNLDVDAIVSNSSGCGFSLAKALAGRRPVRDVLQFLGELPDLQRMTRPAGGRVYVDLPCHLIHGQKAPGIPARVLDATGYSWELAPAARDCCGSGGIYNLERPENAREILARKSEFLNRAAGDPVILATSNHVCLMQWNSARDLGLVRRPYAVRHVIQLLDPEVE